MPLGQPTQTAGAIVHTVPDPLKARRVAVTTGRKVRLAIRERHSFLSFPYVCPEPVLVKRSLLYINGSKSTVSYLRIQPSRRHPGSLTTDKTSGLLQRGPLSGPAENTLPSTLSCLSRAWLGKTIVSILMKWRKKGVFRTEMQALRPPLLVVWRTGAGKYWHASHSPQPMPSGE
jgi:hypothetical protein